VATITTQELANVLIETGQAHHKAYQGSDGFDPEWASWYGPYLQTRLGGKLGREVTRSEFTYLLIRAQREHEALGDGTSWPDYYAGVILEG
jgi:NAD(P)H-hydrate epimerase